MKNLIYICLLLIVGMFISPAEVHAQSLTDEQVAKLIKVPNICKLDHIMKPNRMTGNIVRCVQHVVTLRGNLLIDHYVVRFSSVVFNVTIVAILLFSIRLMYGAARARGVISLFTLKVILVLVVTNPDNTSLIKKWRNALIDFPKEISLNILEHVGAPVNTAPIPIPIPNPIDNQTADVFDKLDKYVIQMYGVDEDELSNDPDKPAEVYVGIAATVMGLLFTGSIGAAVTAISAGFVLAVIAAMAQVVLFFCTIIVALNFLAAITPIAVTCILFQPTKKITKLWFQYLIVYIIQPILLMAFLGLTLGILSQVVGNFDDPNKKILAKWENADGEQNRYEVTLLDCSNMSVPADAIAGIFENNSFMGQMAMQGTFSNASFNRYASGMSDLSNDVQFTSDAFKANFAENCEIKVPALKLNFNKQNYDNAPPSDSYFSSKGMERFMGIQLGVTVLMVMLISFMMKVPTMVNMMVGQGVIADISTFAHSPTSKATNAIIGEKGLFSKQGLIGGAVRSSVGGK